MMDRYFGGGPATADGQHALEEAPRASQLRIPLLLFIATLVVLAANSNQPVLVETSANLRFAMYAVLIIASLSLPRATKTATSLSFVLAALSIYALSSTIWTSTPSITFQRATGFLLLITAVTLTSSLALSDLKAARRCFGAMGLAVAFFLLVGLLMFVMGSVDSYQVTTGQIRRLMGLLVSPNSVGVVAGLFLPIFLGMRRTSQNSISRLKYDFALAILIVSLVLSQSRGGAVAAVVGLLVFVLFDSSLDRAKALVLATAILLAGIAFLVVVVEVPPRLLGELQQRFTGSQPASGGGSGRIAAWALAVDIWEDRSVSGWGFGSAESVFGPRSLEIQQVFQGLNPHNSYFNILLELGPGGVLFLIAAVWIPLSRGLRRRHEPLVAGLLGATCAGVTISVFESGLTAPGSFLAFCFWFFAIGLSRAAGDPGE